VTLKLISEKYIGDQSALFRFLREARAAAKVRHSNVASVFHLGRSGENYFYAMEFVEGETLEKLIKRSGRVEVKLALEIATQVAAGLAAIQEQNLVHRDIKPTNIIVKLKDGDRVTAKIIDLGLAKTVGDSNSESAISVSGGFAGTPEFASPEQFMGVGVDIRSDLYSLGVTLWDMLSGQTPFRGCPSEVMYQHQRAPLPLEQVKGVPQPVVALLEVLLEKDPARRFRNPIELLNALPKVSDAVKARRTITNQSLREIADQRLGPSGKAIEILTNLREVIATRRLHLILWAALVLLVGGGAILAVSIFFGPKSFPPQASRSSSPAIIAPEKSIAVLPFESLSENKSDTYFADGVQDEILSNLAKVSELRVISRTSVMTYRPGGNRNLRSIATALDVARVLEGTVRRDGNRVRITTELIDAETDRTLWSESYDRDLTDIFAIQSEIAQTIVAKLSIRLSPEEKRDIQEKPTENLEAYDLYVQGKASITNSVLSLYIGDIRQSFLDAIALLEKATRLDSNFVLAYCQIAKADDWLYVLDLDNTPQRRLHGDAAVDAALRLKPNLPEPHLTAAFHLYICYRDYQRARVHITIAKEALPNSAEAFALDGYLDRRQGHWAESTRALERAIKLDPKNPEILNQLGANYEYLRQYRDNERIADRLIALKPEEPILKVRTEISLDEKGDLTGMRANLEKLRSTMKDSEQIFWSLFEVLVYSRDWTSAKELVKSRSMEEVPFGFGYDSVMVPRVCVEIQIAKYQGEHPEMDPEFLAGRNQLLQKVDANPEDPKLLAVVGLIEAYLGRKQEAIQQAKRAVEMLPVSKDAVDAPALVENLAAVYALTNEPDLAFQLLDVSVKTPGGVTYGNLKLNPDWDSLRSDPRFDGLLVQLAPKE
jgi:TolB-like protein/tetratricopeptide (TPR) repeat protein